MQRGDVCNLVLARTLVSPVVLRPLPATHRSQGQDQDVTSRLPSTHGSSWRTTVSPSFLPPPPPPPFSPLLPSPPPSSLPLPFSPLLSPPSLLPPPPLSPSLLSPPSLPCYFPSPLFPLPILTRWSLHFFPPRCYHLCHRSNQLHDYYQSHELTQSW